jgi:hypothetical protein|tara:strand:+ start:445 stop:798 length:354 start_codon:yes stop_codon:yes gene_type:complete
MSWKKILKEERIEKAPPFDVQPVAERARMGSLQNLNKELIQYIDGPLKEHLERNPFKKKFTLPIQNNVHSLLVRLAGSQEELETIIKEQYNLEEFFIRRGAIPGHTEGKMAYHYKVR